MWLRAKTKEKLKSGLKMKFVWNTCDKKLGSEMKLAYVNYFKCSLENLQNSVPFREIM